MIKAQLVARRFLNLPYHRKIAVMLCMGLITSADNGKPESEMWVTAFDRAKKSGVMNDLAEAILNG